MLEGIAMVKALGLVLVSMLLIPWDGEASAGVNCVGCACKLVFEQVVCGLDSSKDDAHLEGAETSQAQVGGPFVCWLAGQQPGSPELEEICNGHCRALPTPPPGPCVDNKQIFTRYVTEQQAGNCEALSCPPNESGACADGINNDAFLDQATDCKDPDCGGDPTCRAAAPLASGFGLAIVLAALFVLGSLRLIGATRS
jgi:hypothetical protein